MLMDKSRFISRSDEMLAKFACKAIEEDPSLKKLISSRDQISFSSPKAIVTEGNGKLSIFLYNVTKKTTKQGNSRVFQDFELHYLVTPFTGSAEEDHKALERIINAVSSASFSAGEGEENSLGLYVTFDSLSSDDLCRLWISLDTPLRPSVYLTVSLAEARQRDSAVQPSVTAAVETVDTANVNQLYQAVLRTFTEQAEGWKSRNIVFRQWISQEFKKLTDMSTDEMRSSLGNLGDRLERGGSTAEFVKPLNMLSKYYEHQLNELKGMQKVSRGQQENIELISGWLKDVKLLADELAKRNQALAP